MFIRQVDNAVRLAIRRSRLAPALRRIFRKSPLIEAIQLGRDSNWDTAAQWLLSSRGSDCLRNPQLHSTLRNSINTDIQIEFLLTALRKNILLGDKQLLENPLIQETICSLIAQVVNNEYVWFVSDEEKIILNNHRADFENADKLKKSSWETIALLAMYFRPGKLLEIASSKDELIARIENMPECLEQIIATYLSEFEEEMQLKQNIDAFNPINHSTSRMIAENYEEFPYPRWIDWEFPRVGERKYWLQNFFTKKELTFLDKPFTVLVAGCGTGSKAIEYAIGYGEQANILAIDLSRTSLAYATRMANKYKVNNIKFLQMDILDLPRLDQQFDIIECTGVLHHMKDPLEGGKALVSKLRNHGIMHISLYSELARREIVRFRQDYNLDPDMSSDDIRKYRRFMMQDRPEVIDDELSLRWDFFDLNRCRDLLFHPLEHRYTVPKIEHLLKELELEFRGFETPDIIRTQYWTHYPSRKYLRNYSRWHQFELNNPDAFGNLYEIWSKK